ncbi:uncharacterized protein PFL1_02180 [Pseudozyma flocculosa PF-1]|uniref:transketolase n=1 Tax=Pseudozyma flocculosa TaxID=84751 RepID=A0A5C3FAD9_9BASI|nr:uncharacterized protein PFL1_02180 [Pseudozyma flocculosa PF-1]EPQ30063.1 hypothetical protein PFL1_02180 [Pseudozyma flocculosa PF-1]SPO41404.1 related to TRANSKETOLASE [Pseudozyma flocculosa]
MAPAPTLDSGAPTTTVAVVAGATKQVHPSPSLDKSNAETAAASEAIRTNSAEANESILAEIRCLAADLVQAYKGGHPGTPIGAASIGMALWGTAMRFNPAHPTWSNRDRFVLSAGHACLLQYIYLHLTGYRAWTMDMLQRYHSTNFQGSLAAGHPEIDPHNGIEVTTGPLGQGIANSVGLAMASKHMAAHYNRPGFDVVSNTIWCFTGDGCIAEGVGQEALSLAGHLGLDNLILIYDMNKITVDGTIDATSSEDQPAKLRSMGWDVIEVRNGSTDVAAIVAALDDAKHRRNGRPTCVQIETVIGFGAERQNTGPVHGAALGDDGVRHLKRAFGRDPDQKMTLSPHVYDAFAGARAKGERIQAEWDGMMSEYRRAYPDLAAEFEQRNRPAAVADDAEEEAKEGSDGLIGGLPARWTTMLPPKTDLPTSSIPTRKASGLVVEAIAPHFPQFMVGSADLLESTFVSWRGMVEFQHPSRRIEGGDFGGRQIRYGIREHAMAAVANGLAAYAPHAFVPVISTFFMFFLYAAPAIRMSALQKLRVIGVATHDSIGIGEDGPTHQPIGLASLFRALPNLQFLRPADAEEVVGSWYLALEAETTPSILSLSRHALPLLPGSSREGVKRGGYVVHSASSPSSSSGAAASDDDDDDEAGPVVHLTLVATGSEVSLAIETADLLASSSLSAATGRQRRYAIKVVSMPCMSRFDAQPPSYRHDTIAPHHLSVGIEAWASLPWPRYVGAALSMHTYGLSGPQRHLFDHFGFHPSNLAAKIDAYVAGRIDEPSGQIRLPRVGEFEELLLGYAKGH